MHHIKLNLKVLLLFSLTLAVSNANASVFQEKSGLSQDSLVFTKTKSGKEVVIQQGQMLKVFLNNSQLEKGEFKSLNQDTLVLSNNGMDKMILVSDIKKIKSLANNPLKRILGGTFVIVGVGAMVFGGISLVAGAVALFAENIGAIILVAVPVLGGGGFGLYKAGVALGSKKFNLQSKWRIAVN